MACHDHDPNHTHQHAHDAAPRPCQSNPAGGGCGGQGACQAPPSAPSSSRRTFLKVLVGLFAALWAGLTAFPFLRFLGSGNPADEGVQVASVALGKADAFAPGSAKNFQFGNIPALLVRSQDGAFHAYNAVCTHLGCTVQYDTAEKNIVCACHGGVYDAATGDNVSGPPPKPLAPLKADVKDGTIVVSHA